MGVPRSGTTLLINLLGHHPMLAPIYETRFLRNLLRFCDRLCWFNGNSLSRRCAGFVGASVIRVRLSKEGERFRQKAIAYHEVQIMDKRPGQTYVSLPSGTIHFGNTHCIHYSLQDLVRETDDWMERIKGESLSGDAVWSSAREYIDRLFGIHCLRMGKPSWINKTPGLLNHLDGMSKLYPRAKYLLILRDGRDVAASNLSQAWGPSTVREAARRWKKLILEAQKSIRSKELDYAELRYEDLVESSHRVLTRAFEFLGLKCDVEKILSSLPVSKTRVGCWKFTFTMEDRKIFAREAGNLLIELGYEKDFRCVA